MTENPFTEADPEALKDIAVEHLERITEDFSKNVINIEGLYTSARNIWENMNKNPVMRKN